MLRWEPIPHLAVHKLNSLSDDIGYPYQFLIHEVLLYRELIPDADENREAPKGKRKVKYDNRQLHIFQQRFHVNRFILSR